jgi:hypothetical protein
MARLQSLTDEGHTRLRNPRRALRQIEYQDLITRNPIIRDQVESHVRSFAHLRVSGPARACLDDTSPGLDSRADLTGRFACDRQRQ